MSKKPPITRSFLEWQRAAGSLLTLQTALSRSKRAVPAEEVTVDTALEAMVARQRAIADGLYRVALAETHEHDNSGRSAAVAGQRPSCEAQLERSR